MSGGVRLLGREKNVSFLLQAVLERLGAIIQGKVDDFDKDVIFTEAFVNRHRSKIRGAFSAVTKYECLCDVGKQENCFCHWREDCACYASCHGEHCSFNAVAFLHPVHQTVQHTEDFFLFLSLSLIR